MRRFNSFLLSLLLIAGAALSASAQNITIGAWNIQWLGSSGQRPNVAKNVEQRPEDLAAYIRSSRVDVLGLAEISDTDRVQGTYTNHVLDRTMRLLSTGRNRWSYVLFPKKQANAPTQLVGVAWNSTRAKPVGQPFRVPMNVPQGDASWDRWATAMKFSTGRGRTDFVIIPLHMKSNVGGAAMTRPQREREARFLVAALNSIRTQFSDEDIVLIGDTNMLDRNEPAIGVFAQAGFTDLNDGDRSTDIRGEPFDRAFVFRNQPEFASSQQDVFVPPGMSRSDFFVKLSDHYMVRFLLRVGQDDD